MANILEKLIKLYPKEKFVINTTLERKEVIKRLYEEVSINNYTIQKRHSEKPKKLYEGIIQDDQFKFRQKHYYGENGSWKPDIFGKFIDNSIHIELRFPTLSLIIMTFFIILSSIGSVISIYFMVFKNQFDSILIYLPFIILLIVYPSSSIGYKKAKEIEKKFLLDLLKS